MLTPPLIKTETVEQKSKKHEERRCDIDLTRNFLCTTQQGKKLLTPAADKRTGQLHAPVP
jgi:hypothetical protein